MLTFYTQVHFFFYGTFVLLQFHGSNSDFLHLAGLDPTKINNNPKPYVAALQPLPLCVCRNTSCGLDPSLSGAEKECQCIICKTKLGV